MHRDEYMAALPVDELLKPMKRLFVILGIGLFTSALFAADAANDVLLFQRNSANDDNVQRNVTASANALFAFNGSLVPIATTAPSITKIANLTSNGLVTTSGADGSLSVTVPGTGILTALAINTGSAGAPVLFNGALGTPSSGTVTNLTGTASININGTVGATTPAASTFTTLAFASSATNVADFTGLTKSATSTTSASILGKSMGLTENLFVGGIGSFVGPASPTFATTALRVTGAAFGGGIYINDGNYAGFHTYSGGSALAFNVNKSGGTSLATSGVLTLDASQARFAISAEAVVGGSAASIFTDGGIYAAKKIITASDLNVGGIRIVSTDTLSGAGAVSITKDTTKLTSTGGAQALTLADGVDGQTKCIMHDVDGGSSVLTPTTKVGFSTITFTNAGDSVTLEFVTTRGWFVRSSNGVTITP